VNATPIFWLPAHFADLRAEIFCPAWQVNAAQNEMTTTQKEFVIDVDKIDKKTRLVVFLEC
jgi:hypothetical protein